MKSGNFKDIEERQARGERNKTNILHKNNKTKTKQRDREIQTTEGTRCEKQRSAVSTTVPAARSASFSADDRDARLAALTSDYILSEYETNHQTNKYLYVNAATVER